MSTRSRRATSAAGVLLLLASLIVAVGLPAMAAVTVVSSDPGPGAVCPEGDGWSSHLATGASGVWGSATFGSNSVNVDLNPGYVLEVCAKGGSGYVIYQVTDNGGVQTVNAPSDCGQDGAGQCGLSHWAYRVVTTPSTSTTSEATTSTSEATTSTSEATTTTSEATTTTSEATTTTSEATTTTTAQQSTTTTGQVPTTQPDTPTTPSTSLPFDSVPEVDTEVLGIQVSAPEAAQVATQETLPFTGISTGSMALLAAALAGMGLLLLLAARQNEEKTPARSWS